MQFNIVDFMEMDVVATFLSMEEAKQYCSENGYTIYSSEDCGHGLVNVYVSVA